MRDILTTFWHQHRWRFLIGLTCLVLVGTVFTVPQLRAKASDLKRLVVGSDSSVTIVTDQGIADQLGERVNTLEAEVTALKQVRQGDADLIKKLQADYQAAVSEVAAAHDTFVQEATQVEKAIGKTTSAGSGSTESAVATTKKVSINRGTVAELDTLPGIGPSYAQRIVDYRTKNGPFKTIDDLDKVTGIGPATIEKLRGLVEL